MVDTHKKELEKQLWNIANALRGNMSADEFRDYILGFIFYKYLSENLHLYTKELLEKDGFKIEDFSEDTKEDREYLKAIKAETIDHLGYYLAPSESFENYYKDLSKKIRERKVDVLLVVNMFLTGFDSPPLPILSSRI